MANVARYQAGQASQSSPTEVHVGGSSGEQVQVVQFRQRVVAEHQVGQVGQLLERVSVHVADFIAVQVEELEPVQALRHATRPVFFQLSIALSLNSLKTSKEIDFVPFFLLL